MIEKYRRVMELCEDAMIARDKERSCRQKACMNSNFDYDTRSGRFTGHDPYWIEQSHEWGWKHHELVEEIKKIMDADAKKELRVLYQKKKQEYYNLERYTNGQIDQMEKKLAYSKYEKRARRWDRFLNVVLAMMVTCGILAIIKWAFNGLWALAKDWPNWSSRTHIIIGFCLLGAVAVLIPIGCIASFIGGKREAEFKKIEGELESWKATHCDKAALAIAKNECERWEKTMKYLEEYSIL